MGQERVFNYVYGMALLQDRRTEAGLKQIDRILKDGDSAEAHLMIGMSQRTAGRLRRRARRVQEGHRRNPALPLAHSLYGQMLLTTGDREGARRAFEAELSSNPGDFDANLYTGVILKEERAARRGAPALRTRAAAAAARSGCALPDGDGPPRAQRERPRARAPRAARRRVAGRSSRRACPSRPCTTG